MLPIFLILQLLRQLQGILRRSDVTTTCSKNIFFRVWLMMNDDDDYDDDYDDDVVVLNRQILMTCTFETND